MSKSVNALLLETKDTDPDIRFMALNDLDSQLSSEANAQRFTRPQRGNYAQTLLRTIRDEFDEVRVQTLKCLINLSIYCPLELSDVIKSLLLENKMDKSNMITSSIYTMAIHNILKSMVLNDDILGSQISQLVFNNIESNQHVFLSKIDFIELTNDLIEFNGKYLHNDQISIISNWIINGALNGENIISKRCVSALKYLMDYIRTDNLRNSLFEQITNQQLLQKKPLISLKLCKSALEGSPKLMEVHIEQLLTLINSLININDIDEDFDQQLVKDEITIESLELLNLIYSITQSTAIGSDVWLKLPSLLSYDPYGSNDQEDQEEEEDDEDDDYSGYSDEEDDDEDNENQGLSSRVRITTIKTINTLISNHPLILPQIYLHLNIPIVNQFQLEKNKPVLISLVELLTTLFKATSKDDAYYGFKSFSNIQNGRRKSDVTMIETIDPLTELMENVNQICELFYTKVLTLNNPSNDSISIYYDFVGQLSHTLNGLPIDYLEKFIVKLNELFGMLGVTINATKFYSTILNTNQLRDLHLGYPIFLKFIRMALESNSNHKLTIDSLQLCIDIFTIYIPRDLPSGDIISQLVSTISDLLIEKTSNRNLSIDIRKMTLNALTSMTIVIQNPHVDFANSILSLLQQTINTDLLVQLNLTCLNDILQSGKLNPFITTNWVNVMLETLIEYTHMHELVFLALKNLNTFYNLGLINQQSREKIFNTLLISFQDVINDESSDQFGQLLLNCLNPVDNVFKLVEEIIKLNHFDSFTNKYLYDLVSKLIQPGSNGDELIEMGLKVGQFNEPNVAKFIGTVSVCSQNSSNIERVLNNLQNGIEIYPSLVFINEVSKHVDLNSAVGVYLNYFDSSDDSISNEAIKTTSTIICRTPGKYLNELLAGLNTPQANIIPILKTLIEISKNMKLDDDICDLIMESILLLLRSNGNGLDEIQITTCAQCISQLVIQRNEYLEKYLISTLISKEISAWSNLEVTIAAVTKYLFNDVKFVAGIGLSPMSQLLELSTRNLITNPSLIIKTIGVGNLNVALIKNPMIGVPQMTQMLPQIMESEIKVNKTFVRIQQIGPFKNRIDDGLNYRKQIFESIYYLCKALEDSPSLKTLWEIEWRQYVNRLYDVSVKDDLSITSVGLLTLVMVMDIDTNVFANDDSIQLVVERSRKVLNKKMVDTAVKQDLEKQVSLCNLVVRFLKKANGAFESGQVVLKPQQSSQWGAFIQEIRQFEDVETS